MRKSAFAGLFAIGVIIAISSPSRTHAQDLLQLETLTEPTATQPAILASLTTRQKETAEATTTQQVPPPVVYTVQESDSLHKIAETHKTTWQRLFYKNTSVENPDIIEVGTQLAIPTSDETLAERPLPAPPVSDPAPVSDTTRSRSTNSGNGIRTAHGAVAGNRYSPGYCTWYVKNRRPDLPNNLGNANTWVARAAAQGLATGSTPRAGAVGQQGMHVVYVESVNGDGTVTISEMNYNGLFVVSSRTVPAGTFRYIY